MTEKRYQRMAFALRYQLLPWLLLVGLTTCLLSQFDGSRSSVASEAARSTSDRSEETKERLREGAKLRDQIGTFRVWGDRAMFTTAEGRVFVGLENLNLERVVRTLADNPEQLEWSVTGVATEYRGSNYLLVTHVMLKTNRSNSSSLVPSENAELDVQP